MSAATTSAVSPHLELGRDLLRRWAPRAQRVTRWLVRAGFGSAYVLLVLAYLWPQDFTANARVYLWGAALSFCARTFLFYGALAAAAGAAIALVLRRWRFALAFVPLLAAGFGPELADGVRRRDPPVGSTCRVLSLNLYFVNRDSAAVLAELARSRPDVICFQEYTTRWHAALAPALAAEYPHSFALPAEHVRGTAIYSRRPFVEPVRDMQLSASGGPQLRTVLEIEGRPVALYNVHLELPSYKPSIYRQRVQFARLLEWLGRENHPVILAGDLNATNRSAYADELVARGFEDCHRICGAGPSRTWPARGRRTHLPNFRIDHIFLSAELTCRGAQVAGGTGSDHRAVQADIGWRDG